MDIDQTQIDGIVQANVVPGTDYRYGITAGNFQTPGAFTNRGVGIANARPYSFNPKYASGGNTENIITYTVTQAGYIPISSSIISNIVTASIVDSQLVLDVPRCIDVSTGTTTGTLTVSGYEFYGQKMVTAGAISSGVTFSPAIPRPYRSITSMYVELSSYPDTITIKTTPYFDFPFTNNGSSMNLISVTADSGQTLYVPLASTLPYTVQFQFSTNGAHPVDSSVVLNPDPTQPQTLTTNILRPIFALSVAILDNVTPPFTIWAAIPNTSWSLDPNTITNQDPFPNDLRLVIGAEPYSDGWTDWQG